MKRGYYSYDLPNGEKVEMQFSTQMLVDFCDSIGFEHVEDLSDRLHELKTKGAVKVLLFAMKNFADENKQELKYTDKNIWDLVDEAGGITSPLLSDMIYMIGATMRGWTLQKAKDEAEKSVKAMAELEKNGQPLPEVEEKKRTTWDEIYKRAAAAGLKPCEVDRMTFGEVAMVIEGVDELRLESWKQTRAIAYTIAAANRDPHKGFPSIEKFMPLPGDDVVIRERAQRRKREYQEQRKRLGLI